MSDSKQDELSIDRIPKWLLSAEGKRKLAEGIAEVQSDIDELNKARRVTPEMMNTPMSDMSLQSNRVPTTLITQKDGEVVQPPPLSDAQILAAFDNEMKNDPEAYTRPGECINQITSKELVRATRALLALDQQRQTAPPKDAQK